MKAEIKRVRKPGLNKRLHMPYLKNRITFTSEFYPSDKSTKSLVTAGASGSFNVPLMPVAAAVGVFAAAVVIISKIKSMR